MFRFYKQKLKFCIGKNKNLYVHIKKITGLYSKATLFNSDKFNSFHVAFFLFSLNGPFAKYQNSTASFLWKTSSSKPWNSVF